MTPEERFHRYVRRRADGCWIWTLHLNHNGYGYLRVDGRRVRAHRYSYELHKGPIPEGHQVDHLCRRRACVNPEHLEAVLPWVNIMRGRGHAARNARKVRCKHGHSLEGENMRLEDGKRRCRQCHARHSRDYRKRKKAAA